MTRRVHGLLALAFLVLVLAGLTRSLVNYWIPDDDHLNFQMTGQATLSGAVPALLDQALEALAPLPLTRVDGLAGIAARRDNLWNYGLSGAVRELADRAFAGDTATGDPEAALDALSRGGFAGSLAVVALIWLAASGALLRLGPRARFHALAGLTATLLLSILIRESGYAELGYFFWDHLPKALLNPGITYGPLGMTPRNGFVLLALIALLARAEGRSGLAMVLALLAMVLFHRQQGGLLILIMLGGDLLVRPAKLAQPRVLLPALLGLAYFAATETFWARIGLGRGSALLLMGGGVCLLWLLARILRPHHPRPDGPRRLEVAMAWDGLVISALIAAVVPLGMAMMGREGGTDSFFWPLLPARLIALFQPFLLTTLVAWACLALARLPVLRRDPSDPDGAPWSNRATLAATLGALCLGLLVLTNAARKLPESLDQGLERSREIATTLPLGLSTLLSYRDEERLYLALLLQARTGAPLLDRLLARSGEADPARFAALGDASAIDAMADLDRCDQLTGPHAFHHPDGTEDRAPLAGIARAWNQDEAADRIAARVARACGRP